jgi:hypothetical protein
MKTLILTCLCVAASYGQTLQERDSIWGANWAKQSRAVQDARIHAAYRDTIKAYKDSLHWTRQSLNLEKMRLLKAELIIRQYREGTRQRKESER